MAVEALLVKAFTQNPKFGNPAGVIFEADGLEEAQMQAIATELGFSESVFVGKSKVADFKLRFFTPKQEVPLCGHASIAAWHALRDHRKVISQGMLTQETEVGVMQIFEEENGLIFMEQGEPQFYEPRDEQYKIASLLGISMLELLDLPIQLVSTGGVAKLIIPLLSLDTLQRIKPDLEQIALYCRSAKIRGGLYPFTSETLEKTSDFQARYFNPLIGVNEDPITGTAAGPLACYAREYGLCKKPRMVIEQGFVMKKGGRMYVDLTEGIKVGGHGVVYGKRTF
jgi:PhzF family phenazine biosynthesis protein